MNPIPITPSDLAILLFGATVERNKHTDEANYHWLRRPGAPAVDMPHKIVPPHIAAEITKADPAGAFLHIQTITAPDLTYHVLWEKRHWLESNERVMQQFHTARAHREAFFTTKSRELAEADAHSTRMAHMISSIIACGVPRMKASLHVERCWQEAENEEAFRDKIVAIENLFNITGIYQPPYEHKEQNEEDIITAASGPQVLADGQADQAQAGDAGQPAQAVCDEDRRDGCEDRGPERGADELVAGTGDADSGAGPIDSTTPAGGTDGTDAQGCSNSQQVV